MSYVSTSLVIDPLDNVHEHYNAYEASKLIGPAPPLALQFFAAGTAAAVSCALYNPLDCLRVRWQVLASSSMEANSGIVTFGYNIVRREGIWQGLWRPGLSANVMGMAGSSATRLGFYETVRDSLNGVSSGNDGKTGVTMFAAGLICGSVGYFVTTPFQLLKTIIQAEKGTAKPFADDFASGALKILKEKGAFTLWNGALPLTCRGALFTSGQMVGYDGLKTFAKSHGFHDGPSLHIISSISASFGASFLSAPADYVMAKYMASMASSSTKGSPTSLSHCIKHIYVKDGIRGFWRGWSLFFFRLTPVMITSSTLYEQFRRELGLGYMS